MTTSFLTIRLLAQTKKTIHKSLHDFELNLIHLSTFACLCGPAENQLEQNVALL